VKMRTMRFVILNAHYRLRYTMLKIEKRIVSYLF